MLYDHFKTALYPETHELEDFSKDRVLRLLRVPARRTGQRFRRAPSASSSSPAGSNRTRLGWRIASGTAVGSSSAIWAGEQGINYLTSSVVSIEGTESRDFATIQGEHIDAFRARHHPHGPKSATGVTRPGGYPDRLGDR